MAASGTLVTKLPSEPYARLGFWTGRTSRWSRWDVALITAVIVLGVGWILTNLPAIEYGDPVTHWARLNSVLAGDQLDVHNHHEARFGVDSPALLARLLLGDHPNFYYVAPLTAFAVLLATIYLLGSRIFDRRVGLLAASALPLFPQSMRSASQLLPGGFEATFALLSAYFVLTSISKGPQTRRLLLGAMFLFLGYLAKEQVLFYAPGLVIAIWLIARTWRPVVTFTAALMSLLALESLVYLIAPWTATNRFTMLAGLRRDRWLPVLDSPIDLFDRYLQLPGYWLWAFMIFTVGGLLAWRFLDTRIRGFLAVPTSFMVFTTLSVADLQPLRPLVQFEARFLTSLIPYLLLFLGFGVVMLSDNMRKALGDRSKALSLIFAVLIGLGLPAWFIYAMNPMAAWARSNDRIHPLVMNSTTHSGVSRALANRRPIALTFALDDASSDEIRGNAKRLRYTAVFYLPIDSDYVSACFVNGARQLILLSPPEMIGRSTVLPNATRSAKVLVIDSDPKDPWWLYQVLERTASEIGLELPVSGARDLHTLTMRESADQGQVASLCPGS